MRAALAPRSAAGRLVAALGEGRAVLVATRETLAEAAAVLARPKFAARLAAEDRAALLRLPGREAVVAVPAVRVAECRDPGDDMILAAALAGGADLIVSDDRDLLVLTPGAACGS